MAHTAYLLSLQKSLHILIQSSLFKKKGGNSIDSISVETISENFPELKEDLVVREI